MIDIFSSEKNFALLKMSIDVPMSSFSIKRIRGKIGESHSKFLFSDTPSRAV